MTELLVAPRRIGAIAPTGNEPRRSDRTAPADRDGDPDEAPPASPDLGSGSGEEDVWESPWDGAWPATTGAGDHDDDRDGTGDDEHDHEHDGAGATPADEAPLLDALFSLVDSASGRVLDRPIRPRVKVSAGGLARGEIDVARIEVPAVLAAGLVLDRVSVRAERLRVQPGLPPRLRAGPVEIGTVVSQRNVDRWTRASRLPVRLVLGADGLTVATGVAGVRVGELQARLGVAGRFLRLQPAQARFVGVPNPLVRFVRGYLPLPPLPRGARLSAVEHTDGELAARFRIDVVDEPLTPEVAVRLARLLRVPLPGW